MARILVVGDARSSLIRERGLVGRAAGHEIFWVSPTGAPLPGATMFTLPGTIARLRVIRQLVMPLLLSRAIRQIRPDLVHVHYAYQALATIPLLGFHPLVVSVMGGDVLPDQSYRGWATRFVRALLDSADCITSKSQFLDAALEDIGHYARKVRRVTWGIDLNHFHRRRETTALRGQLGIAGGDFVFFDPRLAQPLYNKHVILAAFARYLAAGPPAVLVVSEVFGSSEYLERLRRQARELGIAQRVRFVGRIDQRDMADYYALADITISIPTSDGFPQTIYEAAACGSFLILGDLPQYREAIHDGLMTRHVRVHDDHALAEALLSVVTHRDVLAAAVRNGADYAARIADKRIQDQRVHRIYEEILASRATSSGS